eukprot:TRINITY_DN110013_c0_g1_i1.p1 TRINITY_DN110013_c0_g1~~TRINITY_DN110013_c0_g1_i1.p1  ORF type:complete len:266 (+),score=62.20 TRINITY_DN110013_c0_g1_i1:78-875(+)
MMLRNRVAVLCISLAVASLVDESAISPEIISADDECHDDVQCSLNALQVRGTQKTAENSVSEDQDQDSADDADFMSTMQEDDDRDASSSEEMDWENGDLEGLSSDVSTTKWAPGGDKVWGAGTGIEVVNGYNVGYYDSGMFTARAYCGGPGCALIVNPPGHRSIEMFHIHFVRYQSYGANLKRRLESKVCASGGWHGGGLPCHGKAAFFAGFPGVFSSAMTGGNIHHASVIAWPASCGGSGTIVQIAYGCSIEHQIRGDFNPKFR